MKVYQGVMRGRTIRALCAAGLFVLCANGAQADSSAPRTPGTPLDLTNYNTAADFDSITPRARLVGQFDLGPVTTVPGLTLGPTELTRTPSGQSRITLLDGVTLGFGAGADMAGRFNTYDAAGTTAYDGLFFSASAVNSPYASLTDGGSFVDTKIDLADTLHLDLGASSLPQGQDYPMSPALTLARAGGAPQPYDTRDASSLLAGVSWDVAPWGGIGVVASQTAEHDGVLGQFDPNVRSADTQALGVSARLQLGGGWMTTASFAQAITKLDLKPGFGAQAADDARSRSYGLAVAKRGLFGNDTMGLAVSRPASGMGGNPADFDLVSGVGARPQTLPDNLILDGQSPETDFELGYVTTFLDGSVALQTNAAYQMNFAGQSGNNTVSFLSRAKIKF
jgi:hypothetical protein